MNEHEHRLLKSLVERIERQQEAIDEANADKSEIYKEAKGHGFDTKVLKKVVSLRKQDSAEREEQEAILDLYMHALGMVPALARAGARDDNSVRDSDAAVQKGTSEMSQHALAGGVPDSAGKDPPDGANESQHPGPHASGELTETSTRSDDGGGTVREARTEAAAVTDRRDGQLHSDQVRPDLTADEAAPPQVKPSSAINSAVHVGASQDSEPSSAEGPIQAEEGAKSQSVRTARSPVKASGGKLPPVARDPHRMGSFVRGETENVRRSPKMPVSTSADITNPERTNA